MKVIHLSEKLEYYQSQIECQKYVNAKNNNLTFKTRLDVKCTMIDGKVCNYLTDQVSIRSCNICGVGPSKVNNLKYIDEHCHSNEDYYKFGLSRLHCWIRFFEYILHISYNMDFMKGSARTKEEQLLKQNRKKLVQENIRQNMSMLVDIVRVGTGTTNTGKLFGINNIHYTKQYLTYRRN